jgi:hypothetical protein
LYYEAAVAKTAMDAVGDPRINDLLRDIGIVKNAVVSSKSGLMMEGLKKGYHSYIGSRGDQLLRFYNKMQNKKPAETLGSLANGKNRSKK